MRLNEPTTPEQKALQDEEARRLNKSNADYLNDLAEKLDEGKRELSDYEAAYIAGALRGMATQLLTWEPSQREGRPRKVPDEAGILFHAYMRGGDTRSKAIEKLATLYNVSDDTIRKALRKRKP